MAVKRLSKQFTRPSDTTAYADNDLVANSTTAGSVTPLVFEIGTRGGNITAITIRKSDTDVTGADFSIRFFGTSPTVANGDNGAISHDFSNHLATVDVGQMISGTDDDYVTILAGETGFVGGLSVTGPFLYALLESNGAYTPASAEVFTVYLTVEYDL